MHWMSRALLLTALAAWMPAAFAMTDGWSQDGIWDDGQAEIAFYQLERQRDEYGRSRAQSILVGTYLVKHNFDAGAQTKSASGTPAFKWSLFYEFESGAYQYKRAWVLNVAQDDLRPLKMSFTSFDWCSNRYEELAFLPNGRVESLARSDDYGNRETSFAVVQNAYPAAQVPVLVRGLDFSSQKEHRFQILLPDGKRVSARAEFAGREPVIAPAGSYDAEKITVRYDSSVPSILGESSDLVEHYWRATGPDRLLVRVEAPNYQLELVEHLRSPYWSDNFYPRLKTIQERP